LPFQSARQDKPWRWPKGTQGDISHDAFDLAPVSIKFFQGLDNKKYEGTLLPKKRREP
jgi:hypothetical protein